MGEAFEAACKELHDAGKPEVVRKHIAERIIAAAPGVSLIRFVYGRRR